MKPLHIIRATKQKKEDELLAINGVTGVDVGKKIVKGKKTAEDAIRVYVKKKRKNVPDNEKIPEEIDGVKTDVIEATFELHPMAVAVADIERKADTGTYDPLLGGISIGPCGAVGGYVYTGTLGCMVKDRETQEVLMMTNYHVLAEKWPVGEQVVQPSRVDTGSCPADLVGSLVRSVISENVDGAVARITNRTHNCSIHEIGDVKGKGSATVGMNVRKRGRTTGYTHGIVDSIDATVTVPYDHGDQILRNQILIDVDTSQSTQFGNSGDSGSVVVDGENKIVGLYFAGTSDGSLGVANPIDAVLNELNVDLCVKPVLKAIWSEEKAYRTEYLKHIWEEGWKNRIKEVSYEKPPYSEGMDWDWRWRYTGPMAGSQMTATPQGTCIADIDARLKRLEAIAMGEERTPQPMAGNCIAFDGMPAGPGPNPLTQSGVSFQVFDYQGNPATYTRIVGWGGTPGLDAGYKTEVHHAPCPSVEITLVRYHNLAPQAVAYDAAGAVVMSATMTVPQATPQTLTLSGGQITRVEIVSPQNEVIIQQYCLCARLKDPYKEKMEQKEFKEKPERKELKEKEFKEKPERKELKEKEYKEKPEQKEFKEKEWKEKPEQKEFKEKEWKEKPESKEQFEGGGRIPDTPLSAPFGPSGGGDPLAALEARLARLEGLLGRRHFIDQSLRPDLSKGALMREPDQR